MNLFIYKSADNNIISTQLNPEINAYGKLFIHNDNEIYTYNGNILNGKFNGDGFIIYTKCQFNNDIYSYEGQFKNNLYEGNGKIIYKNGDVFIGLFSNNKKNGLGKLYNKIGEILIDNIYKNDIICGKIDYIEYYTNTTILKIEGQLFNSIKIGAWFIYLPNKTLDKIIFYKNYDTNLQIEEYIEVLESEIILINGFIKYQKYISDNNILEYDKILLGKNKHINTYKITNLYAKLNIDILSKISVNYIENEPTHYIELNSNGKIIKVLTKENNTPIEKSLINVLYLKDNKYMCKFNSTDYIYEINNNNLFLYYDGELLNYQLNGNGTIYSNQKTKYKGTFENGNLISGMEFKDETIIYSGTFKNFIRDGTGIYYVATVKIYEGSILNDKYNGFGTSYWNTTGFKEWEGMWQNGHKHGEGYLYDENGQLICRCIYTNNNIDTIL